MKLAYPELSSVLETNPPGVQTLVVESPVFLREFLLDISGQMQGEEGRAALSENNTVLEFSKYAELMDDPIGFELNRKTLLNRIAAAMEREAFEPDNFMETEKVLRDTELLLDRLAFSFPCDVVYSKLSISSLIRAVGLELRDEYDDLLERMIDYMELVREFDRDKLFITVNLRSFFSDNEVSAFIDTVLSHEFRVLMLESHDAALLPNERRLTVDADLCEF